jgi:hypothetical protein
MLNKADDRITIDSLRLALSRKGPGAVFTIRVELKDINERQMSSDIQFDFTTADFLSHDLPLSTFRGSIDITAVTKITLVIEKGPNPSAGGFVVRAVRLVDKDGPTFDATTLVRRPGDRELIAETARRDFESLLRLIDRKTGASLDRTLFVDQIHWGATGWLLASLPAAVARGWIARVDAVEHALRILRFVDREALWGDEPVGKIGNSLGIMYRFGGLDPEHPLGPLTGTRKYTFRGEIGERGDCDGVEASVIDTALFQFGAATAAAGLADPEITRRVGSILGRTRWDRLFVRVGASRKQLLLSWKPERSTVPPCYNARYTARAPSGFWASREENGTCTSTPLTIDFWTDEGALAAILAAGSGKLRSRGDADDLWYGMLRKRRAGCGGAVVTFPGAWFTYTYLTATYLDPRLGPDKLSVDWRRNARTVFQSLQRLRSGLPDAVEFPDTDYLAQGLPDCAANPDATFTGTETPWSWQLAVGLGGGTATRAVGEIRRILVEQPERWDPLFGFLDSAHPDLSKFVSRLPNFRPLRTEGRWVQQQVWALNKGAALLAQLNYLDNGVVWRTANRHPVIREGIKAIYP